MRRGRARAIGLVASGLLSAAAFAQQPVGPQNYSAKTLYLLRRSGCHNADGSGSIQAGVPPFPGVVDAFARDDEGRNYMTHVPGVVGSGLSDEEIAIVLNYILDTWSDEPEGVIAPFTGSEVSALRDREMSDVVSYRREVVRRLTAEGITVADYPWP